MSTNQKTIPVFASFGHKLAKKGAHPLPSQVANMVVVEEQGQLGLFIECQAFAAVGTAKLSGKIVHRAFGAFHGQDGKSLVRPTVQFHVLLEEWI